MLHLKNKYILLFFFLNFVMLNNNLFSLPSTNTFFLSSSIRGIPLAEGKVLIKLKRNKYSIKVNAKSVGFFSIILDWSQTIQSFGQIKDNKYISFRYHSSDVRGKKNGHMEIDFKNIPPKIISAKPDPRDDERRTMNNSFLLDVTDPVTGIFNLALNQCKNSVRVYDGKRRYNIKILKKEDFVLDDYILTESSINTYKCSYEIERIAGYTKKELAKFPKIGELWIKKHEELDYFYPVKIQINTTWGDFLCFIKERRV